METITEVKERPILFSTPMIRAILEGRKTVTRRVMNPQPLPCDHKAYTGAEWRDDPPAWKNSKDAPDEWYCALCGNGVDYEGNGMKCRHGKPGDILWVRETWQVETYFNGLRDECFPIFKADYDGPVAWNWKPSIFMPKEFCRLRLEIQSIRVERLHDITEEDAVREGIDFDPICGHWSGSKEKAKSAKVHFQNLWQSINGAESWKANPWVFVISFKKL